MTAKIVELIRQKIDALDQAEFDLDAWKSSVVALLHAALSHDDDRISMIENLKVDYGSWALRDATSTYNPTESCKKQGRATLNSILETLDLTQNTKGFPDELQPFVEKEDWKGLENALNKKKKEELVSIIINQCK